MTIYWVYWHLYGEDYLPLIHMHSSFQRKFSYKVVCMLYKCKNDRLYIYDVWYINTLWWLFNANSCLSENWLLTMTHSSQSGLNGAVGSAPEAKSGGRGFNSHFKQIFALTLKLLIDYILSTLASEWWRLPPSDSYAFQLPKEV